MEKFSQQKQDAKQDTVKTPDIQTGMALPLCYELTLTPNNLPKTTTRYSSEEVAISAGCQLFKAFVSTKHGVTISVTDVRENKTLWHSHYDPEGWNDEVLGFGIDVIVSEAIQRRFQQQSPECVKGSETKK